jgi:hypothetical protein
VERLYPLISYLKIPAERIFSPKTASPSPSLQKLLTELNGCSEEEAADLLPMIRYLLALIRKQDTPSL